MTDAEIIKALECCNTEDENGFANCNDCPYYAKGICLTCPEIFDLINRQKAEIERLTVLAELGNMRANDYRAMRDKCKTAKSEAIKEFAKELINRFSKNNLTQGFYVNISEIDLINLVKEMVGDTE